MYVLVIVALVAGLYRAKHSLWICYLQMYFVAAQDIVWFQSLALNVGDYAYSSKLQQIGII